MAERIGRYEIRRELGRGGMATVYLAFDPRIERQVAIKVLPRQFTYDPKYLDRFQQEARMIAALEHPAIVPIHDFGEHNDAPYLVMRYMAGGNLRSRMKGDPLPLKDIAASLDRLAPALDYAHEVGIVHRDLKPANILFDDQGNPYLADFGIARMAEASLTMTIIGTPAYMSPEQVESETKLDGRSDIYALGVILYELLTGKQPYTAETPTGQMLMHITKPVPNVLAVNPDLPPETQQVIEKAMAKDREERYQSALELAPAVYALIPSQIASSEGAVIVETAVVAPEVLPVEPKVSAYSEPSAEAESELAAVTAGSDSSAPAVDADNKGSSLRGWVWWVGALALILIAVFGIRAIFNGRMDEEATVAALLGDTWMRPADDMTMVYVPEGTFPMGSEDGEANKAPVHEVSLDAFWIDRTEVTNEQFAEFVAATDYETTAEKWGSSYTYVDGIWKDTAGADWQHPHGPASDLEGQEVHPVVHMSWEDGNAYCAWAGGQLPTEAQWEFAARGPQGLRFPWGDSFDGAEANYCDTNCPLDYADEAFDDGYVLSAPVASFQVGTSWSGALNMAGNVAEWVKDMYDEDYDGISPRHNPQGPLHGEFVVLRGGSWDDARETLRSSSRINLQPDSVGVSFGIRCVVAPSATDEK